MNVSSFRMQVSVDLFLCTSSYVDIATIGFSLSFFNSILFLTSSGTVSQITGGKVHHYPGFTSEFDGIHVGSDLVDCLCRETGFESVLRTRCSKGIVFGFLFLNSFFFKGVSLTRYYGNIFVRSSDLLALPAPDSSHGYGILMEVSEKMTTGQSVYIQSALLYLQ